MAQDDVQAHEEQRCLRAMIAAPVKILRGPFAGRWGFVRGFSQGADGVLWSIIGIPQPHGYTSADERRESMLCDAWVASDDL